jgi:hypothetical protein
MTVGFKPCQDAVLFRLPSGKLNLSELLKACLLKVFARFAVISGAEWRSPPTADNFFINEAKKGY